MTFLSIIQIHLAQNLFLFFKHENYKIIFIILQLTFDISGILQFTNSISARQRWARSHDLRSSIISHVYKELDLVREQDVTAELTNHSIKSSINQLQTFIDTFDVFINPFNVGVPKDS